MLPPAFTTQGQPCRLLEACWSETLPFRLKLLARQRSLFLRKTLGVFQSALWQELALQLLHPHGIQECKPPSPPNLEPSNQGVSAGDSWKNQDTRYRSQSTTTCR